MTTGVELIAAVNDDIPRVTGDVADDTAAFYDTAQCAGRDRRGPAGQDG